MAGDNALATVRRLSELCAGCTGAHQVALSMAATEETTAWEALGEVLVPSLDSAVLARASQIVALDAAAFIAGRDQTRDGLKAARDELADQIVDDDAFSQLEARRRAVETRLDGVRQRLKSLRALPGFLDKLDDARAGKALKTDVVERVREHDALQNDATTLDAERNRVAGVAARHRRAQNRLIDVNEQLRVVDDGALRQARRIVTEQLVPLGEAIARLPVDDVVQRQVHRIRGIRAKREFIASLGEPLPTIAAELLDMRTRGESDGFGAAMIQPRIDALSSSFEATLSQHRAALAVLIGFDGYDAVPTGAHPTTWWRAMTGAAEETSGDGVSPSNPAAPITMPLILGASADPGEPLTMTGTSRFLSSTGVFTLERSARKEPAREVEKVPPARGRDVFQLAPGTQLGRYRIKSLIGRGGMAEVYLADQEGHSGFQKRVVLKRIAAGIRGDPDAGRMFAREAQLAARLNHPFIVQIFDYQGVDDDVFIVMEHLEGMSLLKLGTRLRALNASMPIAVALRAIADAARGLHAAHSYADDEGRTVGLVHRDISPDNLFLTTCGITKVLDFGIAKRDDLTTLTGKNELRGKIPYMAPEHIQNERLDARADLFSLGATLYWLLCGLQPFGGTNEVMTLHAVLTKQPPPLLEQRPDVPAGVNELVLALLSKRREDRPASASLVALKCEELGAGPHEDVAEQLAKVAG
ncbi:MAG: protein kinase [Deltaproteobacteria bacterium]|nr:protein kinase [Deltaproteobacteria bacterium]